MAEINVNVFVNAAFKLAGLLSEPDRQLQTGHLYQALQFLGDEEGLRTYPEHLKGEPTEQLSEESLLSLRWGRILIISTSALAGDDLQVIGEQLGLTKIKVACYLMAGNNMSANRVLINMLMASKNRYGQDHVDQCLQRFSHILSMTFFFNGLGGRLSTRCPENRCTGKKTFVKTANLNMK